MRLRLPVRVKAIIDILEQHGYEAYVVGGCVRDSILARSPQDWDITTSAKPAEVKRCFRRTVDTGIQHGTVTVMDGDEGFEVTTYRIDGEYLDGRHPESVQFTSNLEEDLKRRDFTINAMAYNDRTGLVDLFGGVNDLQKGLIRCVGDADARFDEDALRIMRAVRFAAQLGFNIDEQTRRAVRSHAEHLKAVSSERVRDELVKLLMSPHPEMIEELYELGITGIILPEFDCCMVTPQISPYHCYNVGEHTIKALCEAPQDKVIRLVLLLHDFGKPVVRWTDKNGRDHFNGHEKVGAEMADGILRRLKFDNDTRNKVVKLVRYHDLRPKPEPSDVRHAMHKVGVDLFAAYLDVRYSDTCAKSNYHKEEDLNDIREIAYIYQRVLKAGDPLDLKALAVNGQDLMRLGFRGKELGDMLDLLLDMVLTNPRLNRAGLLLREAERIKNEKKEV